ncbi:hypothetical protein PT974_08724 [Cladobotryum mycophilum]|uniref:Uncharacterized protein n=1 Tax=Cladobotryum mycophilum TaxID=491253 RepID=A0ABR0SFJ2_9HYPO
MVITLLLVLLLLVLLLRIRIILDQFLHHLQQDCLAVVEFGYVSKNSPEETDADTEQRCKASIVRESVVFGTIRLDFHAPRPTPRPLSDVGPPYELEAIPARNQGGAPPTPQSSVDTPTINGRNRGRLTNYENPSSSIRSNRSEMTPLVSPEERSVNREPTSIGSEYAPVPEPNEDRRFAEPVGPRVNLEESSVNSEPFSVGLEDAPVPRINGSTTPADLEALQATPEERSVNLEPTSEPTEDAPVPVLETDESRSSADTEDPHVDTVLAMMLVWIHAFLLSPSPSLIAIRIIIRWAAAVCFVILFLPRACVEPTPDPSILDKLLTGFTASSEFILAWGYNRETWINVLKTLHSYAGKMNILGHPPEIRNSPISYVAICKRFLSIRGI